MQRSERSSGSVGSSTAHCRAISNDLLTHEAALTRSWRMSSLQRTGFLPWGQPEMNAWPLGSLLIPLRLSCAMVGSLGSWQMHQSLRRRLDCLTDQRWFASPTTFRVYVYQLFLKEALICLWLSTTFQSLRDDLAMHQHTFWSILDLC